MTLFLKNDTSDLIELPSNKMIIGCHWVYRVNFYYYGSIKEYKYQLIAKGYAQVEVVYFEETFAPMAKMNTI